MPIFCRLPSARQIRSGAPYRRPSCKSDRSCAAAWADFGLRRKPRLWPREDRFGGNPPCRKMVPGTNIVYYGSSAELYTKLLEDLKGCLGNLARTCARRIYYERRTATQNRVGKTKRLLQGLDFSGH